MNSSADSWNPGQSATFHPEGSVYQHASGNWYIRENGAWRLMTPQEVAAMEQKQ